MATSSTTIELTLRGRVIACLCAAAAGAAWLGGDGNARIAAAMLAAPLLVDLLAKHRRLHEMEVRVGPRRTVAGAPFTETLQVVNHDRSPARECLMVEPRTMRLDPPVLIAGLPPGEPQRVHLRGRSLQRSHVLERVFVLFTAWPLGLFRARAVIAVTADLVTEPGRVALAADIVHAIAEREAAPRDRSALPGPEFHSLREHLPDEDARGVHALRSASLGTLVRRVTRGRMPRTVGIVVDLRRPPGRPLLQGSRRFEWSLGAAASLVNLLRSRAAQVDILILDKQPTRILVQSPGQECDFLTLLAEASPAPHSNVDPATFDHLRRLEHSYWIPAGAYLATREHEILAGTVSIVGGEFE